MASPHHLALPPLPVSLKAIAHSLKTASEHENRDPVVTYWCRLSALQSGLKLDKGSKEAKAVLIPLMDWLEKEKKVLAGHEAITSEVVASAYIENYAFKLFAWADQQDRDGQFSKNVVKSFYSAGILFDVLTVFGELTPENAHAHKYAKWKAAYIHNCLKNGERPVPGPMGGEEGSVSDPSEGALGWQDPMGGSLTPQIPPQSHQSEHLNPEEAESKPVPSPRLSKVEAVAPAAPAASEDEPTTPCGLTPAQIIQTQKLCKYASSALDYEDTATAIDNLQKALKLLKTGQES
ncbi:hypothetical protein TCAL_12595 [Tigriopus californicus]|uniref:Vta1/callose synthase N-terminal domain-containing protein n=1 Tax=Tigriopus californicus TaxID=6832 RepID=A0A553NFC1_TIGCA|nr:vacuolar protein sorting-associated protein VTA1 homolog [Tigriopus californicus]TRY64098.1 hypothetical protein TCAL_12595 [Tigriopus californicus]|eukprot:TCALIF_12595-PA protein Name:"Similar to VTA1 Vacuolar protein sorting-associated protein VTA1 homolog (Bos taurus)" AED:0.28 eAED:0.28 QI:0/-1/0/1/-1/1/1/0/291